MNTKYENWGALTDYGPISNPSVLYEYGRISLLHQGSGVTAPPIEWGSTTFTGTDDIWGVSFEWPKDLIAGHEFIFLFKFELLPDLILADKNILWSRSRDAAPNGRVVLHYVPSSDGKVKLGFLKDRRFRDPAWTEKGIRSSGGTGCLHGGVSKEQKYPVYREIETLKETKVPPVLTERNHFKAPLLEPELSPIPKADYPTMAVDIFHETLEAYLPAYPYRVNEATPGQLKELIDRIPVLDANGFSGCCLSHLSDELLETLATSKLRHFIVETCSAGEWWLCRDGVYINRSRLDLGLENCNRLLARMPDCRVYIWFAELEDREHRFFESPDFKKSMDQVQDETGLPQYGNLTDNEFWREEILAKANREWKTQLMKKVIDPARVKAVYQAGSPLAIMRFKEAGSDLTVNKAIFRGAFNITVAAGRGNAKVHGQPLGLDYDPWTWEVRMTHHPDEWRQGLLVYLHAGCNFLFHEGTLFRRDTDGKIKATETGRRVCDVVRYARRHPAVGKQIVRMAAMKGCGECSEMFVPKFMPQLPCGGDPPDWIPLRFRDFNLLDVFFPKFGNVMRGDLQRFMTGTLYGSLDIVPWDAKFEDLQDYDFVFLIGSNGCDDQQLKTFIRYVEYGGKLLLAAGQLRRKDVEPRLEIEHDFAANADILHTFTDGSKILRQKRGKGEVILITTNTLTTLGEEEPRKILRGWGEKSAFVHFDPGSDWIEVMANRKGQTVSLCLFNHGRIGFPSGNAEVTLPWQGTVTVDLEKLGLSGDMVLKKVEDGCNLIKHAAQVKNGKLFFDAAIDYFSEYVFGFASRLERDWLGGYNSTGG